MNFNDLDLLETSAVGIPSNPDAVTAGVAMARAFEEHGISPDSVDADNVAQMVKSMSEDTKEPEVTGESPGAEEVDEATDAEKDAQEAEGMDIVDEVRQAVQDELAEHRDSLLAEVRSLVEKDAAEDENVEVEVSEKDADAETEALEGQLVIDGYESLDELKAEIVEEVKAASVGTPPEAEEPKGMATAQTPSNETESNASPDSATRTWLME